MEDKRCAWCGEKLRDHKTLRTFCGKACQYQYESWSRTRADSRSAALSRWRDLPVPNARTGGEVTGPSVQL